MSEYLSTDPNFGLDDGYLSTDPNFGLEKPKKRSIASDVYEVGRQVGAGAVVDLPKIAGQSIQAFTPKGSTISEYGKEMAKNAEARAPGWEPDLAGRGEVAEAFIKGGRSVAPSVAPLLLYAAGPVAGTIGTAALYGGSQYTEEYDKMKAAGASDEDARNAGLITGGIQGGGEAIANRLTLGLFGAGKKVAAEGIKGLVGQTVDKSVIKPFAKATGAALIGEPATEIAQDIGTAAVERQYGLPTQGYGNIAYDSGTTALAMTALLAPFGLAGHYKNSKRAEAIDKTLSDPEVGKMQRVGVVNGLYSEAKKLNIPDADAWHTGAMEDIANGLPVRRTPEAHPAQAQELQSASTIAAGFSPDEVDTFKAEQAANQERMQRDLDIQRGMGEVNAGNDILPVEDVTLNPVDEPALYDVGYGEDLNVQAHPSEIARQQFINNLEPPSYLEWAQSVDLADLIDSMPMKTSGQALTIQGILNGPFSTPVKEQAAARLWSLGQEARIPTPESLPANAGPLAKAAAAGTTTGAVQLNNWGMAVTASVAGEPIQAGEKSNFANTLKGLQNAQGQRAVAEQIQESDQIGGDNQAGSGSVVSGRMGQPGQPSTAAPERSERQAIPMGDTAHTDVQRVEWFRSLPDNVRAASSDLSRVDARIAEISSSNPLNPLSSVKQINEIQRLTEYKAQLAQLGATQEAADVVTMFNGKKPPATPLPASAPAPVTQQVDMAHGDMSSRKASSEAKRLTQETGIDHVAVNKEWIDADGVTNSTWRAEPKQVEQNPSGMSLEDAKAYVEQANIDRPLGLSYDEIERMQGGRITDKPKTGDHIAAQPKPLAQTQGQAQGTEGKTEGVAKQQKPRMAESADDLHAELKKAAAGIVHEGKILYPAINAVGMGGVFRMNIDGTFEKFSNGGMGVRKATRQEIEDLEDSIEKDQVQVELRSHWGGSGNDIGTKSVKVLHSPTGLSFTPLRKTAQEPVQVTPPASTKTDEVSTPANSKQDETTPDKSITRNGDNIVVIGYPREALENARTKLHANAIIDKKGQAVFRAGTDFTALQEALNPGSAYIPDAKSLKAEDFPMYVSGGKFSNARAHNFAKKFGAKSFDNKPEAEAYAEALTRGEGGNWKAKKHLGKWRAVKEGVQYAQDQTKAQVPQAQAEQSQGVHGNKKQSTVMGEGKAQVVPAVPASDRENASDKVEEKTKIQDNAPDEVRKGHAGVSTSDVAVHALKAPDSAESENDRDHFTLERLNRDTNKLEKVTFERGEYVTYKTSSNGQSLYGEIDGISHARREFSVDGLWHPFGFAYKAERPTPVEKPTVALSSVIDSVNKKYGSDLDYKDRIHTLDVHEDLFKRVTAGTVTADEFKASFEALVKNKDAIVTALSAMTKDAIFKRFTGLAYRYKNEKKADVVKAAYRSMLDDFVLGNSISWSMGEKYEDVIRGYVERTNDQALADHAAALSKARAERAVRRDQAASGMADPQTLEDFSRLMNAKAQEMGDGTTYQQVRMTLTPEQRARFDELAGEKTRAERKARADQQKTTVSAPSEAVGASEIIKTKHTKHGHDLWQFTLERRVPPDEFKTLVAQAKRMGGDYSSYRGNGAIPGWQFRSEDAAIAFRKLVAGDTTAAQEVMQARRDAFQDDKSQSAVERLNEMAERLEDQAAEALGRDRKANTARRARFAASAEAAANSDKALAKTMRNIAQAIADGKAKFLDRVRQKAQVEMLRGFVRTAKDDEIRQKYPAYSDYEKHRGEKPTGETADYAKFPTYTAFRSDLASLGRQLEQVDGSKKLGAALLKVADDVTSAYLKFAKENLHKVSTFTRAESAPAVFASKETAEEAIKRSGFKGKAIVLPFKRGQNIIIMSPAAAKEAGIWQGDDDKRITLTTDFGSDIVEKVKSLGARRVLMPWVFESVYDDRKRLAAIGIETPAEFRAALREFIALQEQPTAPDKIKQMERAMIGRRNDGLDFFPTPASVAQNMIDAAELEEGMAVLEPSAGMGHIAERIREAGVEPDVVEMSGERRELLTEKGFNLVGSDFMDVTGEYDRIIMNPPFSNRRDIEHVRHAYKLLKPGGRLVAIMGEGSFFGSDKKATEFRDWLDSLNGTSEKLDEGTFMDPTLPVNTGANARLVVVDKPEGESPKFSRRPAFFSPLSKAIAQAKQETMPSPQWRLWLNGNKAKLGLKDDEIQFSGINEYLELRGKDKVTKAEIADYLRGIGGKVVSVDTEGGKQPGFSITQEVRENLTEQGLPLFARTNDATQSVPYTYTKASPEDQAAIDKLNSTLQRYFGNDKHGLVPFSGRDTDVSRAFSEEIRSLFKTRVIVVQPKSGSGLFNGFQISGLDAIFVDGTSDAGFIQIAGHELWHHIETTRPDLAKWYGEQAKLYIKDLPAYRNRLNSLLQQGEEAYTDAGAESELLADFLGDSLSDPDFLQRLASSNESKFKRLITSVRMWLGNLAYKMRGLKSSRHIGDVRALQTYLAKVLDAYAAGKNIGGIATPNFQRVWHGTPHIWAPEPGFPHGRPRLDKMGTGEGNQAYGFGWYSAESQGVAETYKDLDNVGRPGDVLFDGVQAYKLKWLVDNTPEEYALRAVGTLQSVQKAERDLKKLAGYGDDDYVKAYEWFLKNKDRISWEPIEVRYRGSLYQLDIPDDVLPYLLDWDKPLSEQTPEVREALAGMGMKEVTPPQGGIAYLITKGKFKSDIRVWTGEDLYRRVSVKQGSDKAASEYLASIGIVGNRYLDGQSRTDGAGTYNFVVWDQPTLDRIALLERNGEKLDAMRDADVRMSRIGDTMPMPDIRFSRSGQSSGRTQADPIWSAEPISKMDTFLYELQDKHIDTKRIIQAIQKQGKQISDEWNVYIKEALYHGRTAKKTEDFLTDEVKPAIELMAKHGISQEDMDEYLHARHAIERNRVMKERNPDREDNDGLSGMTDEDAKAILAKAKPGFKEAAKVIDSIIAKTRQELVGYGLEKQETVDSWAELYSNYVPLQREGFEDRPGTGMGFSVRGNSSKEATGSHRAVENILAHVAMQREKAIVRGEKNRVATALYGLAQQFPNSAFWKLDKPAQMTQINPDTGQVEVVAGDLADYKVPRVKYIGKDGTVKERIDQNYKGRNNVMTVRINGVDHAIIFNDQDARAMRMVESLKNLDADQLGEIVGGIGKVTRYIASMATQYNPVFGVINLIRDTQTAALNLSSTELKGKQGQVMKASMVALKGIYQDARAVRDGKHPSSPYAKLWEEFQATGGQTGYRDMFRTSNDRAEAIEKMLDPEWWQKGKFGKAITLNGILAKPEQLLFDKVGRKAFNWLSDYNLAMENAMRLGAYKVARDNGMSKDKSAFLAKNLTVNFNKKGKAATQAGALYAFFNASAQGTARIAETLHAGAKDGEFLGKTGKAIVYGGITLGAMNAIALIMAGFDDDEPPEFMRERNLIIPAPGTDKGYVSIPMPLGFHVLPNIGRVLVESAVYGKPMDRMTDLLMTMLESFNPIGTGASLAQTISPTVFDPVIAMAENKDWTGKNIYREDFNKTNPTPGFTRTKDSASALSKGIAEAINTITGGTEFKPGRFSPTPDQIDYLIGQVTGGVGREITKVMASADSAVTGEELPMYKVPLAGRLVGTSSDNAAVRDRFYDNVRMLNMHEAEIKGRREKQEPTLDYIREHPETRYIRMATATETQVRNLQKRKRQMIEDGKRESVKLIDAQIAAKMKRLNDMVSNAKT